MFTHPSSFDQDSYYWFISRNPGTHYQYNIKLTNGIRTLNANFKRLELHVEVCQWFQTSTLEKYAVIPNDVHVIDMPNYILHTNLSKTVRKVLHYIGAKRTVPQPQQINGSYNNEISRRKDFEQVIRVTKDIKYFNSTDLDFPKGIWLFINHSLCPYNRDFGTNEKN